MKTQEAPLINKVANSGLITIELEKFYPGGEWAEIDIADFLFKGLILKEKEFRAQVKETEWENFRDKVVGIHCSTDAIVPPWAYMLIARQLNEVDALYGYGHRDSVVEKLMVTNLERNLNADNYDGERILIKGCSTKKIPEGLYMHITEKLQPVVKSLMYGEACSNVPVYKQPIRRQRK